MSQSSSTGETSIGGDVLNAPLIGRDAPRYYQKNNTLFMVIGAVAVFGLILFVGKR